MQYLFLGKKTVIYVLRHAVAVQTCVYYHGPCLLPAPLFTALTPLLTATTKTGFLVVSNGAADPTRALVARLRAKVVQVDLVQSRANCETLRVIMCIRF